MQRLISQRIQRRRRAAFSQFLTVFAWRLQPWPKRVAWVLPRPQYWFETLFHSKAPKVNHEDYFYRNRRYSFVVQGVVDASGSYLSVSTGFPDSMHDARVLRLSNLFPLAEEKRILTMPCMELDGIQVRPSICHQRNRRRVPIGRLLWELIFPFFCFRVVVKGNPQEILLFSCGFQAPDDKTFPR